MQRAPVKFGSSSTSSMPKVIATRPLLPQDLYLDDNEQGLQSSDCYRLLDFRSDDMEIGFFTKQASNYDDTRMVRSRTQFLIF